MVQSGEYTKEFGSFYFRVRGQIRLMTDQVAICFSVLDGQTVLHKHGRPGDVQRWWKQHHNEYRPLFGELVVVESDAWDVDLLNECLDNPALLGGLMERSGGGR